MGRTSEFNSGMTGTGQNATLMGQASTAIVKFRPSSALDVLQQPGYHPQDGNSADDAARQTPQGQIPTSNGSAPDTYNAENPVNMRTRLANG
jgi:hypothetical protein